MTRIRHLHAGDIPGVVALFERVYPHHGWRSLDACRGYFGKIFLEHPWRALGLPSWVAAENGRIVGFYGVVPRPMHFRGSQIRVAVGCNAMVDPDRRHSLIALKLLKACLAGPQELTLADGATDPARRLWVGLGGKAPLAYNLHWIRPLRPAGLALRTLAGRRATVRALALALRPLAALTDAAATRLAPNGCLRKASRLTSEVLDPDTAASATAILGRGMLRPVYDARALAWILEHAARRNGHGHLRARALLENGELAGWYVYYLQCGGVSEVIQVAARDGVYDDVLVHLFADAWRHGAAALRGRLDPAHARELAARHCWSRWEGPFTLVHSRHTDILDVIERGEAVLSRLDGEWWMRFVSG